MLRNGRLRLVMEREVGEEDGEVEVVEVAGEVAGAERQEQSRIQGTQLLMCEYMISITTAKKMKKIDSFHTTFVADSIDICH